MIAGVNNIDQIVGARTAQTRRISKSVYYPSQEKVDIAIFKMDSPFKINNYVQHIALANQGYKPTGEWWIEPLVNDHGGHLAQWIAISPLTQQPLVPFLLFPKFFWRNFYEKNCLDDKVVDVARLIDCSAA